MTGDLARLLGYPPEARPTPPPAPRPGVVVRSDASGVWVAYLGGDADRPLGPCRGARRPDGTRLPVGTRALLVEASDGPWVVAYDEGTP